MLRILGVWLVGFAVWCVAMAGGDFWVVFVTLGFFMTLPALLILGGALLIEGLLLQSKVRWAALAVGPAIAVAALLLLGQSGKMPPGSFSLVAILTVLWLMTSWKTLDAIMRSRP